MLDRHPRPAPKTHQFWQYFKQWDGTNNKAQIKARWTKKGWIASIKIGNIKKDVSATHPRMEDALQHATRSLLLYREHTVIGD